MDRQLAIAWAVASTAVAIAVIAVVGSGFGLLQTEADPTMTVAPSIDWQPVAAQPLTEPEIVYVDEPRPARRPHHDDDHDEEEEEDEEDEWDDD